MSIILVHQGQSMLPSWQIFVEEGFMVRSVSEAHWEGVE